MSEEKYLIKLCEMLTKVSFLSPVADNISIGHNLRIYYSTSVCNTIETEKE